MSISIEVFEARVVACYIISCTYRPPLNWPFEWNTQPLVVLVFVPHPVRSWVYKPHLFSYKMGQPSYKLGPWIPLTSIHYSYIYHPHLSHLSCRETLGKPWPQIMGGDQRITADWVLKDKPRFRKRVGFGVRCPEGLEGVSVFFEPNWAVWPKPLLVDDQFGNRRRPSKKRGL